jgi:hypothetical protein
MQLQIDDLQQQVKQNQLQVQSLTSGQPTSTITSNNNSHNTTNTNSNNTTTNININIFRHEDTSYISGDTLKEFNTSKDLVQKLLELVVLTHFNREHPENMNAYVPKGGGTQDGKVFGKNGWTSLPLHDIAEIMTYNMGQLMWGHVENNEELYKKRQAERVEAMYDMLNTASTRAPIVEGTKATIIENSHVVTSTLDV